MKKLIRRSKRKTNICPQDLLTSAHEAHTQQIQSGLKDLSAALLLLEDSSAELVKQLSAMATLIENISEVPDEPH